MRPKAGDENIVTDKEYDRMSQVDLSIRPSTPDALRSAGTLILLVRTLEQQLRPAAGGVALSMTELGVLSQIDRGVDQPSLVARMLRLDPARVTHLTDRLVALGCIEREIDRRDRRRWRLRLTPEGSARLDSGRAHLRTAMEALLGGLSEAEGQGLLRGLEGVRRMLDAAIEATDAPATAGSRRAAGEASDADGG
jgi:DNA-binding MarR family transcriptional regulator